MRAVCRGRGEAGSEGKEWGRGGEVYRTACKGTRQHGERLEPGTGGEEELPCVVLGLERLLSIGEGGG